MKITSEQERWMQKALNLARKGEGLTRPNPPVGAVVVKNGKLIGAGFHRKAGGPHAEVLALRQAGKRTAGATLYVTLEPCSTWGRTPPCTDAILSAGIRKVVVSIRDPNPRHAGRGLALLHRRGIKFAEGVCRTEGEAILAPFRKWITKRTPFVTLKLGITLDGKIADASGRSRWITGKDARDAVHDMRRRVDAILVGRQTVAMDDPHLVPVPSHGRQPFRVIVDSRGNIPLTSRVLNDDNAVRTIVATTKACPASRRKQLSRDGAEVLILPAKDRRVSLAALFRALAHKGILHVLCEGGGELADALVRDGLVDTFLIFVAPRVLGGKNAVPAIGGRGWPLKSAPELIFTNVERVGADIMIRAIPTGRH